MTTTSTRHGSWILLRRTLCGSALAALLLAPAARAQAPRQALRWDVQLLDYTGFGNSFHLNSFTGEYKLHRPFAFVDNIISGVGTVSNISEGRLRFEAEAEILTVFGEQEKVTLVATISPDGTGEVVEQESGVTWILDFTPGSGRQEPPDSGLTASAASKPTKVAPGVPTDITRIDSFTIEGHNFFEWSAVILSEDGSYSWDHYLLNVDTGEVGRTQLGDERHFDLASPPNGRPGGPNFGIEVDKDGKLPAKVKLVGDAALLTDPEEGGILDELVVGGKALSGVLNRDPENQERYVVATQHFDDPNRTPEKQEIIVNSGRFNLGAKPTPDPNTIDITFDTGPDGELQPDGVGDHYVAGGKDEDGKNAIRLFRNWTNTSPPVGPPPRWEAEPSDFFNIVSLCARGDEVLFASWEQSAKGRSLAIRGSTEGAPHGEIKIPVPAGDRDWNGIGCADAAGRIFFGSPVDGNFSIIGLDPKTNDATQWSIPLPIEAGNVAALGVTPDGENLAVFTKIKFGQGGTPSRAGGDPLADPRQEAVVPALGLVLIPLGPPPAPAGEWLASPDLPGYQVKVQISAGQQRVVGRLEADCLPETLCISGAVPGRPEVFTRVVGPKPNGNLWPNVVKFSTSRVEVWIHQIATGTLAYYDLPPVAPGTQRLALAGLADKVGFLPPWSGEPVGGASAGTGRSGESAPARSRDGRANPLAGAAGAGRANGDPAPPAGPWLTSVELLGFRAKVRITAGAQSIQGSSETDCIGETLCVSGAVAGRSEAFLRVVGPKPNGKLWPTIVKFSTSQLEVWLEQTASGEVRYYRLDAVAPG
ncbi:MAG TPA: hypothetical protein VM599_03270, partial [Thermoanaerobaculia bacterium]|nr:hypothetical protein [Thermoanaerobaculia bacterium]